MWNIPLHTFLHFHKILILNCVSMLIYTKLDKKPLTFHKKTDTVSEIDVKYEMWKRCSVKCARHTVHIFRFFIFHDRLMVFPDCVASLRNYFNYRKHIIKNSEKWLSFYFRMGILGTHILFQIFKMQVFRIIKTLILGNCLGKSVLLVPKISDCFSKKI